MIGGIGWPVADGADGGSWMVSGEDRCWVMSGKWG
jgi:hypothetical protein